MVMKAHALRAILSSMTRYPAVTKLIIEQRLHYNGCFAAAGGHTAATPVKSNSSALIFWCGDIGIEVKTVFT